MKSNLLDLFYNFVIKEAAYGKIDCFFKYNMIFNTKILEDNIEFVSERENSDLFIPTLMIKNKKEFEVLLLEYVQKALEFYDDEYFYEEIRNSDFMNNEKGISKEKLIMTLLWSNATVEDFNDPCSYLRKRIDFFDLDLLEEYVESKEICYSEILDANVEVSILKNHLENETPYSFQIFLKSPDNGERIYEFPRIYMGISNQIGYVYAVQNNKHALINEFYLKKLNRKMYKINEGIDVHSDTFRNFDFGNLVDITPSFLVAINIVMGIFKKIGIYQVFVPSILTTRWNAKMLLLDNKKEFFHKSGKDIKEIDDLEKEFNDNVLMIQSNLTEKFLRYFRRLGYHHSSIGITSLPSEVGSDLVLRIYEGEDICNNSLLDETYSFGRKKNFSK